MAVKQPVLALAEPAMLLSFGGYPARLMKMGQGRNWQVLTLPLLNFFRFAE